MSNARTASILAILWACALPGGAIAGPPGYPYGGNAAAGNWAQMDAMWNPVATWYSGIVERCIWAGTNRVPAPQVIVDYSVYAGMRAQAWAATNLVNGTNVLTWHTNTWPERITVRTTNAFGQFAYSWTNNGGGSAVACPLVTRAVLTALDATQDALYPYFVSTNEATGGGKFEDWFDRVTAAAALTSPGDPWYWDVRLPVESKAGLFARHGIGTVGNAATNAIGFVVGGTALFTQRTPAAVPHGSDITVGSAAADLVFTASNFPASYVNGAYSTRLLSPAYQGFGYADDWRGYAQETQAWANVGDYRMLAYLDRFRSYPDTVHAWTIGRAYWYWRGEPIYLKRVGSQAWPTGSNCWSEYLTGAIITGAVVTVSTNWVDLTRVAPKGLDGAMVQSWASAGTVFGVWSNTFPSVRYLSSTVEPPAGSAISVRIAGWAFPQTNSFSGAILHTQAVETVAVAGAWTPCRAQWNTITSLTVTGSAALGDSVTVIWTNLHFSAAAPPARITKVELDERIAALRPLVWTWADVGFTNTASPYPADWDWYGDAIPADYSAAVAEAIASNQGGSDRPWSTYLDGLWVQGSYNAYYAAVATMTKAQGWPMARALPAGGSRTCDFYAFGLTYPGQAWKGPAPLAQNSVVYLETVTGAGSTLTGSVLGNLATPTAAEFPAEADVLAAGTVVWGWSVRSLYGVVKWTPTTF